MPIRQLDKSYGVLNPEDLSFLQGVFDEICAARGSMDEEEPVAIARKLMVLFKGGARDRELLKLTVSKRRS